MPNMDGRDLNVLWYEAFKFIDNVFVILDLFILLSKSLGVFGDDSIDLFLPVHCLYLQYLVLVQQL